MKACDIPILMYHDIGVYRSPWCITPELLESHLKYLSDHNIHTITMQELDFLLKVDGDLPQDCVVLTFDDARLGVHTYALPLLNKYSMKATLFVVSDWVQDHNAIPEREYYSEFMTIQDVQDCLQNGWELGSHSKTHRKLSTISESEYESELKDSKRVLESIFNTNITSYGIPYGQLNDKMQNLIPPTYISAVSTKRGLAKTPFSFARQWVTPDVSHVIFPLLLTKQTLSICMIVKNEEKFLPACLTSIAPIADEIIIIDTGSNDQTINIAKQFNAKIIEIPWENNFSTARNISLQHATSDWIFVIDADEIMTSSDLILIENAIHHPMVDAYQIITKNYTNATQSSHFTPTPNHPHSHNFPGYVPSIKVRLFKNKPDYRFQGDVHELIDNSIINSAGKLELLPISIHHYGELKNNTSEKLNLHLQLNKKKVEEDPKNEKALFDLAMQQKLTNQPQEALSTLNLLLIHNPTHIPAYIEQGICYTKLHQFQKAEQCYQKAKEIILTTNNSFIDTASSSPTKTTPSTITSTPSNKKYLCEIYFGLGYIYLQRSTPPTSENLLDAQINFENALELNPKHLLARINLGAIYEKQHQYSKAIAHLKYALTLHPTNPQALFNLGVVYEKQKQLLIARDYYQQATGAGHPQAQKYAEKITLFLEKSNHKDNQFS